MIYRPLINLLIVVAVASGFFIAATAIAGDWALKLPITLIVAMATGIIISFARREEWLTTAFRLPTSKSGYLKGAGVSVGILFTVLVVFAIVSTLVAQILGLSQQELPDSISLTQYIYLLTVSWVSAAFGEELFCRGFLMNNLASLFGSGRAAWGAALILQAGLFGIAHYDQGLLGVIVTGTVGLTFGVFYLLCKRNLIPLIIAHGLVNTISFSALYFGS